MVRYKIISLSLLLFLVGCTTQNTITEPHDIAELYLLEQGYTILVHENSFEPYTLVKEDLGETYNMQLWQVQTVNVEDYIGKEIYGEKFIIQNHPLDNWESGTIKALGKTQVYIMIVDGIVIGGTSYPLTEEQLFGASYSLDGKTFEELFPNINWREWADRWIEKYSNHSRNIEDFKPNSENIKVYDENKSLIEISKELFEIYLKRYTETKVSDEVRIEDYIIGDIKIENENKNNYSFYVNYSVKPAIDNYVLAGNGIESENGWIVDRSFFIKVEKENEYYTITGIGTGP